MTGSEGQEHDEHARAPSSPPLAVDGVAVAPPVTATQARHLADAGLLADDVGGLRSAWRRMQADWEETLAGTSAAPALLRRRVDGEWSVLETLRHLVMVTDGWIAEAVRGESGYHPLGLPPHFVTTGRELGLDLDADPTVDEVLAARREKVALVERTLAALGGDDLDRMCHGPLAPFTVLGALQVVVFEEWAHHQYVVRDLERLRRPGSTSG